MKMKRWTALFVCLLLAFGMLPAGAAVRLPDYRGVVTDDANVLSLSMVKAVEEVSAAIAKKCDVTLYVAMVHFLDGTAPDRYAQLLFEQWKLDETAILLLGAAGEDACAVHIGAKAAAKLGKNNLEHLLFASGFSERFAACAYDEATAQLLLEFGDLCERQTGERLHISRLVPRDYAGNTAPISTIDQLLHGRSVNSSHSSNRQTEEDDDDDGLSIGEWVLIGFLIFVVFSRSGAGKKFSDGRRRYERRSGCGCSPIGWLLGLFGITRLVDYLRNRRI